MDAVSQLTISLYFCKQADRAGWHTGCKTEKNIQPEQPVAVKQWDKIKGQPDNGENKDSTDPDNPNSKDIPADVYTNNKQLISGTGTGSKMNN